MCQDLCAQRLTETSGIDIGHLIENAKSGYYFFGYIKYSKCFFGVKVVIYGRQLL
jgi:hypothetical protein